MPGVTEEDIGRPKVAALSERLLAFRSDLLVSYLAKTVTDPAATRLARQRTDLLVTCVDSDMPRMAVSLIGKETLTVHVDIGTHVAALEQSRLIHADVRLLTPDRDGGCVACVGGLGNLDERSRRLAHGHGGQLSSLRRGGRVPPDRPVGSAICA
jgi:hypothetical protein